MVDEREPSPYAGALVIVSDEKDISGEEKDNLLIDNMIFSRAIYKRFNVSGNPNFVLCLGADNAEDFFVIKNEGIFIDSKGENDEEITLLNLDLLLQNMFDWHENIIAGKDYKFAGYKYIIHGVVGNIDVYLLFMKGILYMDFIEYMHGCMMRNLETVKQLCEVASELDMKQEKVEEETTEEVKEEPVQEDKSSEQ